MNTDQDRLISFLTNFEPATHGFSVRYSTDLLHLRLYFCQAPRSVRLVLRQVGNPFRWDLVGSGAEQKFHNAPFVRLQPIELGGGNWTNV
jgi:hypothetical protein